MDVTVEWYSWLIGQRKEAPTAEVRRDAILFYRLNYTIGWRKILI